MEGNPGRGGLSLGTKCSDKCQQNVWRPAGETGADGERGAGLPAPARVVALAQAVLQSTLAQERIAREEERRRRAAEEERLRRCEATNGCFQVAPPRRSGSSERGRRPRRRRRPRRWSLACLHKAKNEYRRD